MVKKFIDINNFLKLSLAWQRVQVLESYNPTNPLDSTGYLEHWIKPLVNCVLMAEAVQPLTDAAKQFLAVRYRDISKFTDEVMRLPLASIEAIFSCDDLQVASEDFVYHLILKWSRPHYPELEERQEILVSRLSRFIRFPYMSCGKLKKVLTCTDFDHEECFFLSAHCNLDQQSYFHCFGLFLGIKAVGYRNLFGIPWTEFISEDSQYILHQWCTPS
ncbi:hypothetical protein DCAR_0520034 [Daucus carota subsp. sativus]|uniref:BACK domain-containing protein n=1 Tax=Daucus carota subsp. sativus TaxID=79200 RepID=A0AAF0X6F7_DAUCS|nr:hypothetical protein DCAR_0520034 [Daucus carota subsp. sativus]